MNTSHPFTPVQRRSRARDLVLSVGLLVVLLVGCGTSEKQAIRQKLTVLAASSSVNAIEEVARLFELENPHVETRICSGPSNGLAQQIMAGAPADVFLSANKQWADVLSRDGLATETVELLTNRMVLIVPKGNPTGITGPSDLVDSKVSRVAIAGENVPAGIYAIQALQSLKIFDRLQTSKKLACGSDVRIALTYVARGEAEAGVVYATDARVSNRVEVVMELDPRSYEAVVYPAVLLNPASEKSVARDFFTFLLSPAAQEVFRRHGFSPLSSQSQPKRK